MKKMIRAAALLLCVLMIFAACGQAAAEPSAQETPSGPSPGQEQPTEQPSEPGQPSIPEQPTGPEPPSEPEQPQPGEEELLLQSLSLKQKIAQMIMPDISTAQPDAAALEAIGQYGFGGIILFAAGLSGTASSVELTCDLQEAALRSESGLPLLIAADQEGGYIVRLGTGTDTCGNMALGATGEPAYAAKNAAILSSELAAEGINVDFAPDMDVNNNPANPIIGLRSFSDDPQTVSVFGKAFIEGLHTQKVAAAVKHFPGHGDTATDSHSGLPSIGKSLAELRAFELIPFKAGIAAGADIVMTAHIQYPAIEKGTYISQSTGEEITLPATFSRTFLTDILRTELGFEGVVCTDAMNMAAVAKHFAPLDAAEYAINAGADILLMPLSLSDAAGIGACGEYIDGIAALVGSGRIDERTIDAAVLRILRLKIRLGLLEKTFDRESMKENALKTVGSAEHHAAEREITEKAVTLVKNDGALPIRVPEGGRVLIFCSYANEIPSVEYAISLLKKEGKLAPAADCRVYCYKDKTAEEFAEEIKTADAVIVGVEEYNAANMDASSSSGWQAVFADAVIERVHEAGKKVAVISIQLPYDLARYQSADALLAVYSSKGMNTPPQSFDGETGTYGPNIPAAICAAFGAFSPEGKLPVDIPMLDGTAFSDKILYKRGFGLSY